MPKINEIFADNQYTDKRIIEKFLCHFLWFSREELWLEHNQAIDDAVYSRFVAAYIDYTVKKKPLEYIIGTVWFGGYDFVVNEATLIPRPETEYMIQAVDEYLQSVWKKHILCDVGTGCGVLGLTTVLHNPDFITRAYLSDYYADALVVAQENYDRLCEGIDTDTIQFFDASLLDYLADEDIQIGDPLVVVANLPYIPDQTFEDGVWETVKNWEPKYAFVWGDDGLDRYRKMFEQLIAYIWEWRIASGCVQFLEMMTWQVDILCKEYGDVFVFTEVKTFHFNIRIVQVDFLS